MKLSEDFRDLLQELAKAEAEYLLIGGYAVSLHGRPRYTKDIDIWIRPTSDNVQKVAAALVAFGAPPQAVSDVLTGDEDDIVWFGQAPARVDVLKRIPGVGFDEAYASRVMLDLGSMVACVISVPHLIAAKRATGRPEDLLDVKYLEALSGAGPSKPQAP